jgi:hypothetical protein
VVLVFESAGRTGFRIPVGIKDFCLLQKPELALGANNLLFGGCRGSFLKVKRSESEVNHSPPTTAEVKNGWSYISVSPICLHVMDMDDYDDIIIIIIITIKQNNTQTVVHDSNICN